MIEVTTRTEHIILDKSGIVFCQVLEGVYMDLADAKENMASIEMLAKGQKVPVLVDIRKSIGVSQKCRAYFAGDDAQKIQSACALLISSPLSKMIGNFFIGFNKTKFPTKLFTKRTMALEWLSCHLIDNNDVQ